MTETILGQSKRKKHWGRHMVIDSWEKFVEVAELIKGSLPINMQLELNEECRPGRAIQPLPFDPRTGNSTALPTYAPALAEVRVSLLMDEQLGWMLPVQFCIGQLLTAAEIISKIADACWFLQSWSSVHASEARQNLRSGQPRVSRRAKNTPKTLVQ